MLKRVVGDLARSAWVLRMVIAEVMMTGACRDDQTIIAHRTAIQQDAPTIDIDTGRLRQKHMSLLVALEDGAQGCDVGRGEPAGRDLVEQRLKQMKLRQVNQSKVMLLAIFEYACLEQNQSGEHLSGIRTTVCRSRTAGGQLRC
jgi:hypothetical protein